MKWLGAAALCGLIVAACGEVKDDPDAQTSPLIDAASGLFDAAGGAIDATPPECTGPDECDDGQYCNGQERCIDQKCEPAEADVTCDDGIDCTDDSCDEGSDGCVFTPVHDNCDSSAPFCDPEVGCRDVPCADSTACDDGVFCNGTEFCDIPAGESMGSCQPGDSPMCDDATACTDDTCDPGLDGCKFTPVDSRCDDGQYCNGAEFCTSGVGCEDGPDPNPDDGIDCTIDSCNEAGDSFDHTPDHGFCDDGKFCTGTEQCDTSSGCLPGTPPTCDDGVSCTVDTCDPDLDDCMFAADDGLCDDGMFCNGAEKCDPVSDCQDGPDPDPSDGIGCTVDTCVESTDTFDHMPDDTACDDGLFCNGAETCDPTADCVDGTAPVTDDGVYCTIDSCDEGADIVRHIPADTLCDNGLFCDGTERCDPTLDCQTGTPPDCGVTDACFTRSCSEGMDACFTTAIPHTVDWRIIHPVTSGTVASGSVNMFCGGSTVVYSVPDACGLGKPMNYYCAVNGSGKVVASAVGTSAACANIAGTESTTCSTVSALPGGGIDYKVECCL